MQSSQSLAVLNRSFQGLALFAIAALGVAALSYTILATFGVTPWLHLPLSFGETTYSEAGIWVQIALTIVAVSLMFVIPTNARIAGLEQSHRRFQIGMEDVARAYHLCHTADRAGVFTASSEFDAVRQRLAYLRDHPDLEKLEPAVLEVAAQMSQQARHLADVYSDTKVARAKNFLRQRQEEAEAQQARIVEALHTCQEIQTWTQQVELEESIVASQLSQLDEKLQATLPALGYSLEADDMAETDNIVPLAKKPAAE